MADLGRMLLGLGLLLIVIGPVLVIAARFGLSLGRLPGDISYRGKNASVFFPIGTSILISVVLSILFYVDLPISSLSGRPAEVSKRRIRVKATSCPH